MKKILVIVPFAMSEDNRQLRRQQLDSLSLPPGVHFEYRSVKAGPVNYAATMILCWPMCRFLKRAAAPSKRALMPCASTP